MTRNRHAYGTGGIPKASEAARRINFMNEYGRRKSWEQQEELAQSAALGHGVWEQSDTSSLSAISGSMIMIERHTGV